MTNHLENYFRAYLQEDLNVDEIHAFRERLASDDKFRKQFEAYKSKCLNELQFPKFDKQSSLSRVLHQVQKNQTNHTKTGIFNLGTPFRFAAALVFFLGFAALLYFQIRLGEETPLKIITKETGYGQKSTLTLSDGSTVRLNSGSRLVFPETFDNDLREVILEGEAFFDVVADKSRPFHIVSSHTRTKVVGTSFNIKSISENDFFEVSVLSGKVAIGTTRETAEKEDVLLEKGKRLTWDKEKQIFTSQQVDLKQVAPWLNGYLYFEDIPLIELLSELEKWFGVPFELEDPTGVQCSLTLKQKGESLNHILQVLRYSTNLNYSYEQNKVIISGKC